MRGGDIKSCTNSLFVRSQHDGQFISTQKMIITIEELNGRMLWYISNRQNKPEQSGENRIEIHVSQNPKSGSLIVLPLTSSIAVIVLMIVRSCYLSLPLVLKI